MARERDADTALVMTMPEDARDEDSLPPPRSPEDLLRRAALARSRQRPEPRLIPGVTPLPRVPDEPPARIIRTSESLPWDTAESPPRRVEDTVKVVRPGYDDIKSRVHRGLLERLNLASVDDSKREEVKVVVRRVLDEILQHDALPLNYDERDELTKEVLDEIFGLGPLEPLLNDPEVSDILVNTHRNVFVERRGKIQLTDVHFVDDKHLMRVIDRIVSHVGRRIDDSSPTVDARLPDGSRVHAIIPPVAIDGPHLSIRKFKSDALTGEDLVRLNGLTAPMLELLRGFVKARLNILISGSTGAGKTTLLNILSASIPADERIVTVEDSAELQLRQPHVVRLETRPPNIEGEGEISQRVLVKNCLRMRPDRIIVGEVRGAEAIDMLQAMNTGHDGSLATLHANTPRDAMSRLETMISMAGLSLPEKAVRQQIASAVQVIVQVARLSDGTRKVITISEVDGMEGDIISLQDIFRFNQEGIGPSGRVIGNFKPSGVRSRYAEQLHTRGIDLSLTMFSEAGTRGLGS